MKLDPIFTVKENKLYKISDNSEVNFTLTDVTDIKSIGDGGANSIYNIIIEQKTIEPEYEAYSEEYLADLRDALKVLEEKGQFAVLNIIPGIDDANKSKILNGTCEDDAVCDYVACVKHTARRVKDCVSVAGIFIREDFLTEGAAGKVMTLQDELLVKHAQYVFFADKGLSDKIKGAGSEYSDRVVLV
ncbi:MAG: hypothetical protein KBS84_06640 [Treponema sp.]|nr:hypothetical protein [Candidatus Treponema scatequi]